MTNSNTHRQFVFSPWLTLLALALIVLMLSLGRWQLNKADTRRVQLQSYADATNVTELSAVAEMPQRYSQVAVNGVYDTERQIILDGFATDMRPGYQVMTPFRVYGPDNLAGQIIMVNRGWRQWNGPRTEVHGLDVAELPQRLVGRAERFWQPGMTLGEGNRAERSDWPQLAVYPSQAEISGWLQEEVAPWQLLLDPEEPDGFVRVWQPSGLSPARHTGYAWQWFALSITLLVLYLVASFRPITSSGEDE